MATDHATATARRGDSLYPGWVIEYAGERIDNPEQLCVGAREEAIRRWPFIGTDLTREDLLDHLVECVLRKYPRYVRGDGTSTLRGFVYHKLPERCLDFWRHEFGRNGERRPDGAGAVWSDGDSLDLGRSVPDGFTGELGTDDGPIANAKSPRAFELSSVDADVEDGWAVDRGGLYAQGDRRDPRRVGNLGGRTGAGTPRGGARAATRAGAAHRDGGQGASRVCAWVDCECGHRQYAQAPNGKPGWHVPDFCPACNRALT